MSKKTMGLAFGLAMIAEAMMDDAMIDERVYIPKINDSRIGNPKPKKHLGTSTRIKVRTEPKIRVNEPCPCGSNKKAKKCCHKKY